MYKKSYVRKMPCRSKKDMFILLAVICVTGNVFVFTVNKVNKIHIVISFLCILLAMNDNNYDKQ